MTIAAQLIINGLISGSLYALVAVGFSLIYNVCDFMHFAHGASVTVSAFIFYTLAELLSFPFIASIIGTVLLAGCFGLLLHYLYIPLRTKGATNAVLLVASIGFFIFFQSLMLVVFGADTKTIDTGQAEQGMTFIGATVTSWQLTIIATSLVILLAMWFFLKRTWLGTHIRAVADSQTLAETVGIDLERVHAVAFTVATALAGVAAILIGLEQNIEPTMGFNLIIRGFTGAIVGGIVSIPGAIIGSYLLGLVENIGIWYLPSGYKDAIAFSVLFLFLLFRPEGIIRKGGSKS